MPKYELFPVEFYESTYYAILRHDDDGVTYTIPSDPRNSDYQRYLIDTDGGLPIPDSEPKV